MPRTKGPATATQRRTSRKEATAEPSGLVLNKQELHSVREIAYEYPHTEFLYLRENQFQRFDPYIKLENLKVLDLSLNSLTSCDFLWGGEVLPEQTAGYQFKTENLQLPMLRHLYLTGNAIDSLRAFRGLNELETLALSSNRISSFEGMGNLPQLRVLSLKFNQIQNFRHFPFLPCLHSLSLLGNPIDPDARTEPEKHAHFRVSALAVAGQQLQKIDNVPVTEDTLEKAELLRGKVVLCMTEGFEPRYGDAEPIEDQAEAFLLRHQQEQQEGDSKSLKLHSIVLTPSRRTVHPEGHINAGYPGPYPPTEGKPITLHVCLQDTRPFSVRKQDIFHSHLLYPVAFKVTGDADNVLVVGSMNHWGDAIPLEKIGRKEDGDEVFFQGNLYLPPGQYEYRYLVDGIEKILDEGKQKSKFGKGNCNIYPVTSEGAAEDDEEERDTILHVRWLRNNRFNGFDLISDENSLKYVPTAQDVGCCLRVEVLVYENGLYSSMVYDVTAPVLAADPEVTSMKWEAEPKVNEDLRLRVTYMGGEEGPSEVAWLRVKDGVEEDVTYRACDVFNFPVLPEDVGFAIRAVYTPKRSDGFVIDAQGYEQEQITEGQPASITSEVVRD
eukprot:Hpha_TRINITY_DN12306_c0_g1::TRINITY_DN12306_c0_g1_i1::g.155950::m.155950